MMSDSDIRKGFQSKLGGFEAPVPADGWESVERSLRAATAARTALRRRWYAGSVAAVLILLVGSILFLQNPVQDPEIVASKTDTSLPIANNIPDQAKQITTASQSIPESAVQPAKSGQQLLALKTSGKAKIGGELVVRSSSPSGMMEAWLERERVNRSTDRGLDAGALRLLVESIGNRSGKDKMDQSSEDIIVVGGDDALFAGGIAGERREGTLLLALNGKGGLTGYQQKVNSPMTLRSATVSTDGKYLNDANKIQFEAVKTDNISEMEHDQPVSFGVTVSKYLFDDLSIETGLIYSYLHSKSRNTNNSFQVQEVQKLHYLGVPLNINYNLFSVKKLNIYASIGGMVEKDVYGEFRKVSKGQTTIINNLSGKLEEKEILKISQRNPQLSVNAGVGLSYPVYDGLRLYGKMGGAYYFDAKNPYKTIYSDRKIVMDLNLGLRYEF
ncbi:outer membrane beta-barrel protein [Proteiniphilum sp.]|uniref:outer membrane beta-barrel protein n=1 Tax=Proteiniphilum sp. TaxID=1926877 RepID=UPI002B1EA32D|nr:hypothetical protein [Proteiniphilum sp.]MEA4916397.1 hypothetical protein [Proteiniphilum sp.]